jgi:hypothetical protein
MIDKRPCTIEDFEEVVDLNLRELGTYIEILIKEKIIEAVIEERGIFYRKI